MDKQFIVDEITQAQRAHDKLRLAILRLVKNEVDTQEKDQRRELSDQEITETVKRVLKQTRETLEASEKAGTDAARTANLREQVEILDGYLPAQVTGDDLASVVDDVIAAEGFAEKRDMGKAIGAVAERCGGNCDKAEVAKLVSARLG